MWDHINGVTRRLKDIAAELASPQFEDEEVLQQGHLHNEVNTGVSVGQGGGAQSERSPSATKSSGRHIAGQHTDCYSGNNRCDSPYTPAGSAHSNFSAGSFIREVASQQRGSHGNITSSCERVAPPTRQTAGAGAYKAPPIRSLEATKTSAVAVPAAPSKNRVAATSSSLSAPLASLPERDMSNSCSGVTVHSPPFVNAARSGEELHKSTSGGDRDASDNSKCVEQKAVHSEEYRDNNLQETANTHEGNAIGTSGDIQNWMQTQATATAAASSNPQAGSPLSAYNTVDEQTPLTEGRCAKKKKLTGNSGKTPPQETDSGNTTTIYFPSEHVDYELAEELTAMPPSFSRTNDESARKVMSEMSQVAETMDHDKVKLTVERERVKELLLEGKRSLEAALREKDEVLCRCQDQAEQMTRLVVELATARQQRHHRGDDEGGLELPGGTVPDATGSHNEQAVILTEEVELLRRQLQEAKQSQSEAIERLKITEREEYDRKVAEFIKGHNDREEEVVRELQSKLNEAQQQLAILREEKIKLVEEQQHDKKRLMDAESEVAGLSSRLASSEHHIVELQGVIASSSKKGSDNDSASLISALTTRKQELESENARLLHTQKQLEQNITNSLVHANVEFPPPQVGGTPIPFFDIVNLMVNEFNRLVDANKQAYHIQMEMERTYENARMVNATVSQQVNEAWKTIGALREELSLCEQTIAELKQQQLDEAQEHRNTQTLLASVTNELQSLKEEQSLDVSTRGFNVSRSDEGATGSNHDKTGGTQALGSGTGVSIEKLRRLEDDIETLRSVLHERDEELLRSHQATENLQQVLDTFTLNKSRDIEERTAELQVEIDELRGQLADAEQRIRGHQKEVDEIMQGYRRELAAKNVEISALHHKHLELRRALGDTARQLNGESLIDKRVISHLTVNFIHAFVAGKPESDGMLKVLSGLLNWDEPTQEKAGLIPGPTNPKPGQQQKGGGGSRFIGGIMSSMWGGRRSQVGTSQITKRDGGKPTAGIAELWVDFLMRESDAGMQAAVEVTHNVKDTPAESSGVITEDGGGKVGASTT